MVTKVQKWGNSQGLRIAKHVLADANISLGDDVDVSVNNGKIIISPTKQTRRKYDIKKLLAHMPEDYRPEEVDWGKPAGKEVW